MDHDTLCRGDTVRLLTRPNGCDSQHLPLTVGNTYTILDFDGSNVKNVSPLDPRRKADGVFGGLNLAFFAGEESASADTDCVPFPQPARASTHAGGQSLRDMSTPVITTTDDPDREGSYWRGRVEKVQ